MKSKKILVIDDDPKIVDLLKVRLASKNYEVVAAYDGIEGIEKSRLEKPDLVLLDIMMPRMDGSTFLQEVKKTKLLKKVPIIIMTAKANMREFFVVEEVRDFFAKPFDAKDLLQKIALYLGESTPKPCNS